MEVSAYNGKEFSGEIVQHFTISPEKLWNAITEPEQMRCWFFENIPDFKPEIGFTTSFPVQAGEREFVHLWELLEVIPKQKLVYRWHYRDYEGESFVIFSIEPITKGSRLHLLYYGAASFPQHIAEFKIESARAGWEYLICHNLKNHLSP